MAVEFERKTRKKRRWGRIIEYTSFQRRYLYGEGYKEELDRLRQGLGRYKTGVTPQELAISSDYRVSVAKQLLYDLEKEGLVECRVKSRRVRLYVPIIQ
ncbi:MAG: hypothetical protein ACXAC7_02300 [Candidatus Hodarchaeales archaeon]|jgi:ribosomal protein S25